MPRDLSTLNDIKYISGPVGNFLACGKRQINFGQYPDSVDIELRSDDEDDEACVHAKIPFDVYFEGLLEIARDYRVD